jgi:hypothetical protein
MIKLVNIMDYSKSFYQILGKEYLSVLGINFFPENPEYAEIKNMREKFLFLNSFGVNPSMLPSNQYFKRTDTISMTPILAIEKNFIGNFPGDRFMGYAYASEILEIIKKSPNIFCFKKFYSRDKGFEEKINLKEINYFEHEFKGEHAILNLLPQLFFRKKGYCVLGGGMTKLSKTDYSVDFIAYNSPTIDLIKDCGLVKDGFFVEELALIRELSLEFVTNKTCKIESNQPQIILIETEGSRKEALNSRHGIMQILPKLKLGMANCGYVVYEGERVNENDINQRLSRDIRYKEDIGIINIKPFEIFEPKTIVEASDNKIREYAEKEIRYNLLCNLSFDEILTFIESENQKCNHLTEIFSFLFNSEKLPIKTIINRLTNFIKK